MAVDRDTVLTEIAKSTGDIKADIRILKFSRLPDGTFSYLTNAAGSTAINSTVLNTAALTGVHP